MRDENDNRWLLLPSVPVRAKFANITLTQRPFENIQLANFLVNSQLAGYVDPIDKVAWERDDPPDVTVELATGQSFAVELTTLSTTELTRGRLSEARWIEQALSERLAEEAHPHLQDRVVFLSELASDDHRPPKRNAKKLAQLVDRLIDELQTDFGVVGTSAPDVQGGIPQSTSWADANVGRRWIDEYALEVHPRTAHDSELVVSNVQVVIDYTNLCDRLTALVKDKDRPENEILLITTGMPDKTGYKIPADHHVFALVHELAAEQQFTIAPKHLNQVIFHRWDYPHFQVLYQRPEAPLLMNIPS